MFWKSVAIALCIASVAACRPAPALLPVVELDHYHNEAYGFSLSYPVALHVEVFSAEHLTIGSDEHELTERVVEVGVFAAAPEDEPLRFESFVYGQSRLLCTANGAVHSLRCTDVLRREPFETNGIAGIAFHLRHETVDVASGEVVSVSSRGPFFALNITPHVPDAPLTALIVRAPTPLAPEEVDADVVLAVARSVRFLEEEPVTQLIERTVIIHDVVDRRGQSALVVDYVQRVADAKSPAGYRIENTMTLKDTLVVAPGATLHAAPGAPAETGLTPLAADRLREAIAPGEAYRLTLRAGAVEAITHLPAPALPP